MLTELDRAYLAGLLDGEGCITAAAFNVYPHACVAVGMCDKPTLTWLSTEFGNKVSSSPKGRDYHSEKWQWSINGQSAKPILLAAQPYLRIKKLQCELALALVELGSKYVDRSTRSTHDILLGNKIAEALRALNPKGRLDKIGRP